LNESGELKVRQKKRPGLAKSLPDLQNGSTGVKTAYFDSLILMVRLFNSSIFGISMRRTPALKVAFT